MLYLTPEYWYAFELIRNNETCFNGVMFEQLVRYVLEASFEGQWEKTSQTWDGGKDFVDISIVGGTTWAECKMHKSSLSIRAVSNTMVMAVSKQVKRIIIFSYSPLNKSTVLHLASFGLEANMAIQVFADEQLEELIIASKKTMLRFFPDFKAKKKQKQSTKTLFIDSFFSTNVYVHFSDLDDFDGVNKERRPSIPIHTPCLYEIVCQSRSVNDLTITLDMNKLMALKRELNILNRNHLGLGDDNKLTQYLMPGETRSIKFYLAPTVSSIENIPGIEVLINGKSYTKTNKISITISKLNRPELLIGGDVKKHLDEFDRRISSGNISICSITSGRSGVGKSRFLEESRLRLLAQNYSVRLFDGHWNSCKNFDGFYRSFLAQLWYLPDPSGYNWDREAPKVDYDRKRATEFDLVCELIYDNHEYSGDELEQKVLVLSEKALKRERVALLFDNVQAFDSTSIHFISEFTNCVVGRRGHNVVSLAFNVDDLVFSQTAAVYFHTLKEQAVINGDEYSHVVLQEFTRNQVCMFLDSIIRFQEDVRFSERYSEVTNCIQENVLPRPLDLFQLLKAAEEAGNITVENDFFFVSNIPEFLIRIKQIQKTTAKILDWRFERLLSSDGQKIGNEISRVLLAMTFIGDMSRSTLLRLTESSWHTSQKLIDSGILSSSEGDRITFFHPTLARFLAVKARQSPFFSYEVISAVNKRVAEEKNNQSYSLARFAMLALVDSFSKSHALDAINRLKDIQEASADPRHYLAAGALNQYLLSPSNSLSPKTYVHSLVKICRTAAGENNLKDFVANLEDHYSILKTYSPEDDTAAKGYYYFARQTASYIRLIADPNIGIKILSNELNKLNTQGKVISSSLYAYIESNLMDRTCVCLKKLGKIQEAEKVGNEAYKVALGGGVWDMQCLSLIDLGHLYYGDKRNRDKLTRYWSLAMKCYNEHREYLEERDRGMIYACRLLEARLNIITNKVEFQSVINSLDILTADCRKSGDVYYLIKSMLTKGIVIAKDAIENNHGNIPEGIAQNILSIALAAEDLGIISDLVEFNRCAIYLQAIILQNIGNHEQAKIRYQHLIKEVKDTKGRIWSPNTISLIADSTKFWRQHFPNEIFPLTPSQLVKKGLDMVQTLNKPYPVQDYQTIYATGDINLPVI